MPRGRLAPLALLFAAACLDSGPPVWAPTPDLGGPSGEACARARAFRGRVPALLEAGRLDRAARVLQRAEELCPPDAPPTWGPRVTALAALGRSSEAMQLAARIERSERASEEDRKAAAAARTLAETHGRAIAFAGNHRDTPELFDPAEKRRTEADVILHRAAALERAGDHAQAKKAFLEAWEAFHPNPRALVEAGLAARAAGERAEAQRLFDRATYDDASAAIRPDFPEGAPSILSGAVVTWSQDGGRFTVGGDQQIDVFDTALHPTLRLRPREKIHALAFSSDGGKLAAGFDGTVRLYDTFTGAVEKTLTGHRGPVRAVTFSPDGHALASAGDDGTVRIWNAASGAPEHTCSLPKTAFTHLAFDARSAFLAAATDDGKIALCDAAQGGVLAKVNAHGGAVKTLSFQGDALSAVTAKQESRWDVSRPKQPRSLPVPRSSANNAGDVLDTSAHGGLVAHAMSKSGEVAGVYHDRTIVIAPSGGQGERRELSPSLRIEALATSADGKAIAAASEGRVLVWRAEGERVHVHEVADARALAFSADGRTLAIGMARARVLVRDLDQRRPDLVLDTAGAVQSLAFSPDGTRLVAGTAAPSVQLFRTGSPGESQKVAVEGGPVRSVRFSPDGKSVLVASKEGVLLWTPDTHEGLRFVPYGPEPRDVAFTPDGGMVVADQRGELLFGKPGAATPAPLSRVPISGTVLRMAVARDGTIATAEGDRTISLRAPTGKAFQRFKDPDGAIEAIGFLPAHVAAGLGDGSVRLYKGPDEGPAAILRVVRGMKGLAGVVSGPRGQMEIVGPGAAESRSVLRCKLGEALLPFEVCADQFEVEGVMQIVMAGKDPAEAEP